MGNRTRGEKPMQSYVIATTGTCLDTPVFDAGRSDAKEAIGVFTDRKAAADYIDAAGWNSDHQVVELDSLQLLRWIVASYEDGIQFLTVNPDHRGQMADAEQPIIVIEEKLAAFAESLTKGVVAAAEAVGT
jgi:hypothetical protein